MVWHYSVDARLLRHPSVLVPGGLPVIVSLARGGYWSLCEVLVKCEQQGETRS